MTDISSKKSSGRQLGQLPEAIVQYGLDTLTKLIAVPSVAAEGRGIDEASTLTAELLLELGLHVEIHDSGGAPVVFADSHPSGFEGAPTVLFYNHYDVQPADPLELWESDPFTLTEKDGIYYGRGAIDDKGELSLRLAALKWLKDVHGELPCRVKFLVEGEEEIGSPHLVSYLEKHLDTYAADVCVWEFGDVNALGQPQTYCGLKGILSLDVHVRTAKYDLHSSLGAVVDNPIYRLAAALTSLRDQDGHVLIDGFYDDVQAPNAEEHAILESLPHSEKELAHMYGIKGYLGAVSGRAFHERLYYAPVVNINGFHSGYGGMGSKTVLPAEASAKLDIRLVPDQDPATVLTQLQSHLHKHGFDDVIVTPAQHAEKAARSSSHHPWIQTALTVMSDVYDKEAVVYPNSPGSGPIHPFIDGLGVPIVGIGCGHPDGKIHSPNENMHLAGYQLGLVALAQLLEQYPAVHRQG
jgi:acetylornithine deacetylase/succinyl-diaminopimelate desuccinylase-like protein